MAQKLVYFNSRDTLIRTDISQIAYFEGDGNYTYIVTANKLKTCLTMNLSHTEEALAAQLGDQAKLFMRIGKRYIVNMSCWQNQTHYLKIAPDSFFCIRG